MITDQLKDGLKRTFHETVLKTSVFSADEILDLKKKLFSNWQASRSYQGGKILFNQFTPYIKNHVIDILKEKFPNGIPGIPFDWSTLSIGGNIYITSSEYGLHTDAFQESSLVEENKISFKNIIIPLDVCGINLEKEYINNVIFMKNRLINYDSTFQKNSKKPWTVKLQQNIYDYSTLEWYDDHGELLQVDSNKMYISDQEYDNHFNSIKDKQVLDSFIIEKIAKFEVGNIIVHDSCQVHVTGNMSYKDSMVTNKIGVRFGVYTDISNIIKQ
jgi:hypothetical protein